MSGADKQNLAFFTLLIETFPEAIIYTDTDGVIELFNAAAVAMFGFSKEEAIGISLNLIIPEQFRRAHWRGFDNAIRGKTTKYQGAFMSTKALHSSGRHLYVSMGFSLLKNAQDEVIGVVASIRDISAQFAEQKLQQKRLLDLESLLGGSDIA